MSSPPSPELLPILKRLNAAVGYLKGRIDEAREMLETACRKDESLRELAETDEDLVGLR